MRRAIAGWMHRFAWWIDRRADDVWNIDTIIEQRLAEGVLKNPHHSEIQN